MRCLHCGLTRRFFAGDWCVNCTAAGQRLREARSMQRRYPAGSLQYEVWRGVGDKHLGWLQVAAERKAAGRHIAPGEPLPPERRIDLY